MLLLSILSAADDRPAANSTAEVKVTRNQDRWSYEVVNQTPYPISIVSLFVEAPFRVIGSPIGWTVQTDGCSTVAWFSADADEPYPHDIKPGESLGGFSISSAVKSSTKGRYTVQPWDQTQGRVSKVIEGTISVPGRPDGNCAHD